MEYTIKSKVIHSPFVWNLYIKRRIGSIRSRKVGKTWNGGIQIDLGFERERERERERESEIEEIESV